MELLDNYSWDFSKMWTDNFPKEKNFPTYQANGSKANINNFDIFKDGLGSWHPSH